MCILNLPNRSYIMWSMLKYQLLIQKKNNLFEDQVMKL